MSTVILLFLLSTHTSFCCGNEGTSSQNDIKSLLPEQWFLADGNGSSLPSKISFGAMNMLQGAPLENSPSKEMDKRNIPKDRPLGGRRVDGRRPDAYRDNSREVDYEKSFLSFHGHEHDSMMNYGGSMPFRKSILLDSREARDRDSNPSKGDQKYYRDTNQNQNRSYPDEGRGNYDSKRPERDFQDRDKYLNRGDGKNYPDSYQNQNRTYPDDSRRISNDWRADGNSKKEENYPRPPPRRFLETERNNNEPRGNYYPDSRKPRVIHRIIINNKVNCRPCPQQGQCSPSQQLTIPQAVQIQGNNPYYYGY